MDKKLQAALDAREPYIPSGVNAYINSAFYGEFGNGKTVFAAMMVQKRGLFVINDEGWVALKDWPELLDKVELVEYDGPSHLRAIAEAIKEEQARYKEFDLVCIDTMSAGNANFIDFLTENYTYSSSKMREKALAKQGSRLDNLETPGQPDYHLTRNAFRPAIEALAEAPVDVVFNCHLREPSPLADEIQKRPDLTGAVYKVLGRKVQIMGYMERKGDGAPKISFKTSPRVICKSQIRALDGKDFENPNEVIKIIQDWKAK